MGKPLDPADVAKIAIAMDIEPALIWAVWDVESGGRGFLPDGRPKILFERHIFFWRLEVHGGRALALKWERSCPDLCNRRPGAYVGGPYEHTRLERAKGIHQVAAIESASWGAFQVMGFNARACGYPGALAFEEDMRKGELQHLAAFLRWTKQNGLMLRLKAHEWAAFAKGYNGPEYRRNRYDVKLAEAWARRTARPA